MMEPLVYVDTQCFDVFRVYVLASDKRCGIVRGWNILSCLYCCVLRVRKHGNNFDWSELTLIN